MVERYLQGTLINDPVWLDELNSFSITKKDKQIIKQHKKLFRKIYLHYLKQDTPPKEVIEKTKNIVLNFKNEKY